MHLNFSDINYFEKHKPKGLSSKIRKGASDSTLDWYLQCRDFPWDVNQRYVIKTFVETDQNLIINAVAGAGKTKMLQALTLLVPSKANGRQIAFNKAIADELANSGRLMTKFTVSTFHSLGYGMLRQHNNGSAINVDDRKIPKLIQEWFTENMTYWSTSDIYDNQRGKHCLWLLDSLIKGEEGLTGKQMVENIVKHEFSWLRNTLLETDDVQIDLIQALEDLIGDLPIGEHLIDYLNLCEKLLEYLKKATISTALGEDGVVDFDDMIYLPYALGIYPSHKNVVFVDECQDLNNTQLDMIQKMLEINCRIVAVGDPRQAVYGFRGANPQSWQTLIEMLNPLELDMTYTYRCSQVITEMAATLNPKIVCPDFASKGEILGVESDGLARFVKEGDLIICRTNGPLLAWFFSCVSLGTKVKLLGREVADRLLKHLKGHNLLELSPRWLAELEKNIQGKARKAQDKGKIGRYVALMDDLCCLTLCHKNLGVKTLGDLRNQINLIAVDEANDQCVRISTVHRAKGLESDRVFLLNYQWLPFNHPDGDTEQEINLTYVAITRAKTSLYLVGKKGELADKYPRSIGIEQLTQKIEPKFYKVYINFFINNVNKMSK